MIILGLTVPEGQKLWCWNAGGETGFLLFAADEDEAYRKAIAVRLDGDFSPENMKKQQRWFSRNDTLFEVLSDCTIDPFTGDLPDFDDDEEEDDE